MAAALTWAAAQSAPSADHHQHLFSPALAALISPPAPAPPVASIDATQLVSLLDAAGIRRAAVIKVIGGMPNNRVTKGPNGEADDLQRRQRPLAVQGRSQSGLVEVVAGGPSVPDSTGMSPLRGLSAHAGNRSSL